MAAPHVHISSIGVSCMGNIDAETRVAEGRPVVVVVTSVSPLLAWVVLSLSKDKTSTSAVSSLLDSKNPVSVSVASNMTCFGIKDPNFSGVVVRCADSNAILVFANRFVEEQHSVSAHPRPDHERSVLDDSCADVHWLLGVVVSFESLVQSVVAGPHDHVLVISVFTIGNICAELFVAEWRPVVVLTRSVSPLLAWIMNCLTENK
jgi:hypothetical protein